VLERDVEEKTCIVRHSILKYKTKVEDDCRLAVQRDVLGSKLLLQGRPIVVELIATRT